MVRKIVCWLLFIAAWAMPLRGQPTGALQGRVVELASGLPLEGALVQAAGTDLRVLSDSAGAFLLLGLTAGEVELSVERPGYEPAVIAGVEVRESATMRVLVPIVRRAEHADDGTAPAAVSMRAVEPAARQRSGAELRGYVLREPVEVAALQPGVLKQEGSDQLYMAGGRGGEAGLYVDGVPVPGGTPLLVPPSALEAVAVWSGAAPARYGDALSGAVSVTTRSGGEHFSGSFEAITSEVLDPYGFNRLEGSLGGPLFSKRAELFVAGSFRRLGDTNPRAVGWPALREGDLDVVRAYPQAVSIVHAERGDTSYVAFPSEVAAGLSRDALREQLRVAMPEGWRLAEEYPEPVFVGSVLADSQFVRSGSRPGDDWEDLTFFGSLRIRPSEGGALRLSVAHAAAAGVEFNLAHALYAPDRYRAVRERALRAVGAWSHHLSPRSFYQLQADYVLDRGVRHHPGFTPDVRDVLHYGDVDHPANAVAARYLGYDPAGNTFQPLYRDGDLPGYDGAYGLFALPGARPWGGYTRWRSDRLGLRAHGRLHRGVHMLTWGATFEQAWHRRYQLFDERLPEALAARFADDLVEADSALAVDRYEALPFEALRDGLSYYGYNYLGTRAVGRGHLPLPDDSLSTSDHYDVSPHRPRTAALYGEDDVRLGRLDLRLGLRVELIDNNAAALWDPFALVPVVRARDLGLVPKNVGLESAVYYDAAGGVVGFRDRAGIYYDPQGNEVARDLVAAAGRPQVRVDELGEEMRRVTPDVLTSTAPQLVLLPRFGATLSVGPRLQLFADYVRTAQRSPAFQLATVLDWQRVVEGTRRWLPNPALSASRAWMVRVGGRKELGRWVSGQLSVSLRRMSDLPGAQAVEDAFPNPYYTLANVAAGWARGLAAEVDLLRFRHLALTANYTLTDVTGVEVQPLTAGGREEPASSLAPYERYVRSLTLEQRHRANLVLDYQLGEREGPRVLGGYPFANFGFNVTGSYGSGLSFVPSRDPLRYAAEPGGAGPEGIRPVHGPAYLLLHFRVDSRFSLGFADLVTYLAIQNALGREHVVGVYPSTGQPGADGWLHSFEGRAYLTELREAAGDAAAAAFQDHYRLRELDPRHYGIPRLIRLGLRVDF